MNDNLKNAVNNSSQTKAGAVKDYMKKIRDFILDILSFF